MKRNIKKISSMILLIITLSGCSVLVTDSMLSAAHQDMDKNHDGYIDFDEYLHNETDEEVTKRAKDKGMSKEEYLRWDFNRADGNRDGKITAQELIDLFRQ